MLVDVTVAGRLVAGGLRASQDAKRWSRRYGVISGRPVIATWPGQSKGLARLSLYVRDPMTDHEQQHGVLHVDVWRTPTAQSAVRPSPPGIQAHVCQERVVKVGTKISLYFGGLILSFVAMAGVSAATGNMDEPGWALLGLQTPSAAGQSSASRVHVERPGFLSVRALENNVAAEFESRIRANGGWETVRTLNCIESGTPREFACHVTLSSGEQATNRVVVNEAGTDWISY